MGTFQFAKKCRQCLNLPSRFSPATTLIAVTILSSLNIAMTAMAGDISWVSQTQGNWNEPTNWSGGAIPQPADSVSIAASTVTVSEAISLDGTFVLIDNALLVVNGATASFTANGPTTIEDTRLQVLNGARGSFPNPATYAWDI